VRKVGNVYEPPRVVSDNHAPTITLLRSGWTPLVGQSWSPAHLMGPASPSLPLVGFFPRRTEHGTGSCFVPPLHLPGPCRVLNLSSLKEEFTKSWSSIATSPPGWARFLWVFRTLDRPPSSSSLQSHSKSFGFPGQFHNLHTSPGFNCSGFCIDSPSDFFLVQSLRRLTTLRCCFLDPRLEDSLGGSLGSSLPTSTPSHLSSRRPLRSW